MREFPQRNAKNSAALQGNQWGWLEWAGFCPGEAGFKGRAIKTGQGACRSTRSAFEPKRARIENPAPCTPIQIKSMSCSSA
jgi:hypothetical protein